MSTSSQSLSFILSLRMNSSFLTSSQACLPWASLCPVCSKIPRLRTGTLHVSLNILYPLLPTRPHYNAISKPSKPNPKGYIKQALGKTPMPTYLWASLRTVRSKIPRLRDLALHISLYIVYPLRLPHPTTSPFLNPDPTGVHLEA